MFEPVSSRVNFPQNEEKHLEFWKQNHIFEKSVQNREGKPRFVLYEGPPTANGNPGIHHVLARAYKDIITRYKVMKGYYAPRIAGWDTHGLPVEIEVEKQLGFSGKAQIEAYGVEQFNAKCRDSVFKYLKEWDNLTERIAYWVDLEHAYITMNNSYIESVWWAIKQMWDKGLIYQGYKVTPHCPRCGTSLSSHEVALGYQDVDDISVYVRFRLGRRVQNVIAKNVLEKLGWDFQKAEWKGVIPSFLAWTTTPWTLTANVALAVAPNDEYVLVQTRSHQGVAENLILAKALLEQALGHGNWEILNKFQGNDLVGILYERLYALKPEFVDDREKLRLPENRVVTADFVSMTDGTGIVHIAPAFGEEDYEVGRLESLPIALTVDLGGRLIPNDKPWDGKFIKEADPLIIEDLKLRNLLYRSEITHHTYPFCWRCNAPLVYYAKQSWYIRTTAVKDELINGNKEINWYPEHVKEGRFGNWLKNNVDWAFSRERYWGTPLPVWKCEKCGVFECIGGVNELKAKHGFSGLKEPLDLHRPFVDDATFTCGKCGGQMKRAPEVIDCWFDSGSMPFAQVHYPFENKDEFDKVLKQADYICEGVDQTRGWFYSLHAISTLLFDRPCYKNCICLELVLDAKGEKMSKSKGNVVKPMEVVKLHGADALRWYCYTSAPPGSVRRFDTKMVGDITRQFLLTLWNVYSFFVMYANIDNYKPDPKKTTAEVPELDLWILSELNQLIQDVDSALENYNPTGAGRKIEEFVDMLSNWYVRRSRRRFWKSESDTDKLSAYNTLYHCLVTVAKLMAPFTPYIAEELYQNLVHSVDKNAPLSVHLADFPMSDQSKINQQLSEDIRQAMKISSVQRANRAKDGKKVRQPLGNSYVINIPVNVRIVSNAAIIQSVQEEVNVKCINLATPEELASMAKDPNYVVDDVSNPSTAICRTITPELEMEGQAREIVHRLQSMRKTNGFEIVDNIVTFYQGDDYVKKIMTDNILADYIKKDTLSRSLIDGKPEEGVTTETFKLNDHSVVLAVKKV